MNELWGNLRQGDWIVPFIHGYAILIFVLLVVLWRAYRSRLRDLARRASRIAARIEGDTVPGPPVALPELPALLVHLGDMVSAQPDERVTSILEFVRKEEDSRPSDWLETWTYTTETMIELLPMLGIFGTVWGISAVSADALNSPRLLELFAVATVSTLWALFYVVIFRIAYSLFLQSLVQQSAENGRRFVAFLSRLEQRSRSPQLSSR